MDPVSLILAIVTGGAVIGGYLFFSGAVGKQKQSTELTNRISSVQDEVFTSEALPSEQEEAAQKSTFAESLDSMTRLVMPLVGQRYEDGYRKVRQKMNHAGIASENAVSFYLFYQYIGSLFMLLLSLPFLLSKAQGLGYYQDLMTGGLFAFLALYGHKLYVNNAIEKRKKVLVRSFPDALDLLLVCVESGLALDAALARVCSELGAAHPTITEEFSRTRMELSLMNDRGKALYAMGERTGLTAFRSLAAALIQAEKFGTSLADTLRVMSDDYRQTRLLAAENKANRLPALMTIPLITMLLPAMFIIILGPAIIGVINQGGLFGNAGG